MNTTFNINRLGLLLKRYFVENKQRELTFWGIAIIVFMLFHANTVSVLFFMFISGFIFAGNTFRQFKYAPGGLHYLMIPATHFEKLVVTILLSTIYYFIMLLITYVIGNIIGTYMGNLIFGTNNEVTYGLFHLTQNFGPIADKLPSSSIFDIFIGFVTVQSIFLLGSIYFRSNPVGKTFLVIGIFSFVVSLLEIWFLKHSFDTNEFRHMSINLQPLDFKSMFPGFEKLGIFLKYATAPFFWVVSYFRLTEKEV